MLKGAHAPGPPLGGAPTQPQAVRARRRGGGRARRREGRGVPGGQGAVWQRRARGACGRRGEAQRARTHARAQVRPRQACCAAAAAHAAKLVRACGGDVWLPEGVRRACRPPRGAARRSCCRQQREPARAGAAFPAARPAQSLPRGQRGAPSQERAASLSRGSVGSVRGGELVATLGLHALARGRVAAEQHRRKGSARWACRFWTACCPARGRARKRRSTHLVPRRNRADIATPHPRV